MPCNSYTNEKTIYSIIQKKTCGNCNGVCNPNASNEITQKRIWKQVRVQSSLYAMVKSNINVIGTLDNSPLSTNYKVNWNQSSDRNKPSIQSNIIYSRGSSTAKSITRNRPGSCSSGGQGVDIKHNSYDRYLARLKGNVVKTNNIIPLITPISGNKVNSYGILSNNCKTC
jgi:hypothetical protein